MTRARVLQSYIQSSSWLQSSSKTPTAHSCSQKKEKKRSPQIPDQLRWWASLPQRNMKKKGILTSINNQAFSRVLVALKEGYPKKPCANPRKKSPDHTLLPRDLLLFMQKTDGPDWRSNYSIFWFFLTVSSVGPCIIYCTLCKLSSMERIINFLSGFSTATEFLGLHHHSDTHHLTSELCVQPCPFGHSKMKD